MSVKRYKLYLEKPTDQKDSDGKIIIDRIASFIFDENDGKGYENKAHLSTIDKLTTNYIEEDHLLYELTCCKKNTHAHLNCLCGDIDILSSDLNIVHNKNGEKYDYPLFSEHKVITDIPLKDYVTCDVKSAEFEKFFDTFLKYLYDDCFYRDILTSKYYNEYFKDYVIGYREYVDHSRSKALMLEQLKGYAMMRKAYMDVIQHNKQR